MFIFSCFPKIGKWTWRCYCLLPATVQGREEGKGGGKGGREGVCRRGYDDGMMGWDSLKAAFWTEQSSAAIMISIMSVRYAMCRLRFTSAGDAWRGQVVLVIWIYGYVYAGFEEEEVEAGAGGS